MVEVNRSSKKKGGSIVGKKKNDKKVKGKKAVKVVGMLLALCLFAVPAMAADLINTPFGLDNLKGLNLQGDTLYLPSSGSFAVGAGMTLATVYNDTLEIRGEIVSPISDEPTKAGLGIGVNVPKLISQFGGSWLMSGVNASIGVTGLINLNGLAHFEPAIYVTLFQVGL